MARARMVSNAITRDKRVNELSDDTSRLAFTWLITFADAEGRTHGDPAVVRSMLFPRRSDISVEQMESYIIEWAASGMIEWYEAAGDLWIHFVSFDKHQLGLRKDREAHSEIPDPSSGTMPQVLRIRSGLDPDQIPVKLKEVKLKEVNIPLLSSNGKSSPITEDEYKARIVDAIARGTNKDGDIKQRLIDLFHITPNWNTKGNRLFLQWAKGIPPEQSIEQFARWWYSPANWRSKGHSPPSLAQIMELWLQAFVEKPGTDLKDELRRNGYTVN